MESFLTTSFLLSDNEISAYYIERISTCADCNKKHDDDDTACRIPSSRSNKPHTIAFNSDGSLKYVELKIMNLRPPGEAHPTSNKWEEIGVWNSEKGKILNLFSEILSLLQIPMFPLS